ncbi:MAG: LysM peptidoglycan-binding domain-containing protein [Anaerolineae bacterium]|nr:LysM peptidoglycan-binding domain-containing protein [Anaerolineae bacterium]
MTEIEGTLPATLQPPGTPALVVESAMPMGAVTETPAVPKNASSAPASPPAEPQTFIQHPVEPGDTLWGLAVQYGVPMAAIQLQNNLGASTMVKAGQVLEIPPPNAWESASTYWVIYEVAGGDTLSGIAAQYGLTTAELVAANGLDSADFLSVGQALILPLKAPAEVLVQAPTPTSTPFKLPTPTLTSSSPTTTPIVGTATVVVAAITAPLPADLAAWPGEVWRIMNETRAAYGLPPYAYNDTLAQAAQLHAQDCSQRGSCSHTGSDGSDIKTRILRVGYSPASYAECWAVRPSPQGVIDIWMDETPPNDPHRRTVLHTWFTEVGIGVAESPWKGYYYVIADFGRPR